MYLWVVEVLLEGSLLTSVISVSSTLFDDDDIDDILDVDDESDRVDGGGTCAKADILDFDSTFVGLKKSEGRYKVIIKGGEGNLVSC